MPPTEIYTLSLHDALPICGTWLPMTLSKRKRSWLSGSLSTVTVASAPRLRSGMPDLSRGAEATVTVDRSEEHTSELQSLAYLVCRPLLEKKKTTFCIQYDT